MHPAARCAPAGRRRGWSASAWRRRRARLRPRRDAPPSGGWSRREDKPYATPGQRPRGRRQRAFSFLLSLVLDEVEGAVEIEADAEAQLRVAAGQFAVRVLEAAVGVAGERRDRVEADAEKGDVDVAEGD